MLAFISRLFGWLFSKLTGIFSTQLMMEVAKWTAKKTVVLAFIATGIYVVFNNVLVFFIDKVLTEVSGMVQTQGTFSTITIELTGLAAYFANEMNLVPAFALIITGVTIRAIRQFLPF